ncbi:formate hydrogenlyase subunit 3 [Cronobacter dublinensis]
MNAIFFYQAALAAFGAGLLLALLTAWHKPLSARLAGLGGALGCLCASAAGGLLLIHSSAGPLATQVGTLDVRLTAFNAIWLATLGLPGLFICLFTLITPRDGETRASGALMTLLLGAATLAVTVQSLGALVVMVEIVALAAVFLTPDSASGKLWFALGRLGTLLLALACWLLWRHYGTLDILALSSLTAGQPFGAGVWLLGLAGFGLHAGIVPLHGGVVQAHAQASAPAAALFSAVVLKVGLYGILVVSLMNAALPLWCAVLVLALGMVTAFIGGLYALMEHNINRLLAYHTLENIGIILLGLGSGLAGISLGEPTLIALGLVGGLYHLFNHSLFKTTLFLGAGAVFHRTGHRDIEKLGGIGKTMPLISLSMLVGLMAMAALPPLNGFAGEWVIYQAFFDFGAQPLFIARLLGPLLAVGLAITGALAVMCMAKVYGVTFLGAPRTPAAANATDAPWLMRLCVAGLALCCLAGGIAAPWLLPLLGRAVPLPLVTQGTTVSQPVITLLLAGSLLLPLLLMTLFKGDRLASRSRGSAWVCGYDHEQAMVITAHGFARPVKAAFAPLIALRHILNPARWLPGWQSACLPALCRRLALVELAVLLVVVISRGV